MSTLNAVWTDIKPGWQDDKAQRLKVCGLIVEEAKSAIDARSPRHPRWDQLETLYYDRSVRDYQPYDGAADVHVAIIQPKLDTLTSMCVGTVTSVDPVCRAVPYGKGVPQEVLRRKEEIVWGFLKHAGLQRQLDTLSPIAGYTNAAHLFCYWVKGSGFSLPAQRPQEVVVWPAATVYDPEDAKMVGRRYWLRKGQVEQNRKTKGWLNDAEVVSTADPTLDAPYGQTRVVNTQGDSTKIPPASQISGQNEKIPHRYTAPEDGLVEMYDVTFTAPGKDGNDALFRGKFDFKGQSFLELKALEGMPGYKRHCAFKFSYKPEVGFGYWSRSSVADNLQHNQLYANEVASLSIDGTRSSVFPTVYASSYSGTNADKRTSPGEIVLGVVLESQGVVQPRPDLTYVLPTLQFLIQYSDVIAHISVEGSGGQAKKGTTATEVQARSAGQSAGIESYIRCFGATIEDLFAYAEGLLVQHFEEAVETPVGMMLGLELEDMAALTVPCCWKLAATTPNATPVVQANFLANALAPLKQNFPAGMLDDYAVTGLMLAYAARSMGMDVTGLQLPRDPQGQVQALAQTTGTDPQVLGSLVGAAQQHEQERRGEALMGGRPQDGLGGAGNGIGGGQEVEGGQDGQGPPALGLLSGLAG